MNNLQLRIVNAYGPQNGAKIRLKASHFVEGVGFEMAGTGPFASTRHLLAYYTRGSLVGVALYDNDGQVQAGACCMIQPHLRAEAASKIGEGALPKGMLQDPETALVFFPRGAAIPAALSATVTNCLLQFYAPDSSALAQTDLAEAWQLAAAFLRGSVSRDEVLKAVGNGEELDSRVQNIFVSLEDGLLYYGKNIDEQVNSLDGVLAPSRLAALRGLINRNRTKIPFGVDQKTIARNFRNQTAPLLAQLSNGGVTRTSFLPWLFGGEPLTSRLTPFTPTEQGQKTPTREMDDYEKEFNAYADAFTAWAEQEKTGIERDRAALAAERTALETARGEVEAQTRDLAGKVALDLLTREVQTACRLIIDRNFDEAWETLQDINVRGQKSQFVQALLRLLVALRLAPYSGERAPRKSRKLTTSDSANELPVTGSPQFNKMWRELSEKEPADLAKINPVLESLFAVPHTSTGRGLSEGHVLEKRKYVIGIIEARLQDELCTTSTYLLEHDTKAFSMITSKRYFPGCYRQAQAWAKAIFSLLNNGSL